MFIVSALVVVYVSKLECQADRIVPRCYPRSAPPLPRSILRVQAHAVDESFSLLIGGTWERTREEHRKAGRPVKLGSKAGLRVEGCPCSEDSSSTTPRPAHFLCPLFLHVSRIPLSSSRAIGA